MVLVDSLDMGYDLHSADTGIDLSGRIGTGAVGGLVGMDSVRCIVCRGSAGQSHDACLSSILRAVGLVAKIPARVDIARGRSPFVVGILSGSLALAGAELSGLRPLRFYSRR